MIEWSDVWKEKKNYGRRSVGVVRTTYVIDEQGIIVYANDKVKAAEDAVKMLENISWIISNGESILPVFED